MMQRTLSALALVGALVGSAIAADAPPRYPETRRGDQVDDFHGTKVADPYRWLEQDVRKSDDVKKWVEAENEVTFAYLKSIPEREVIQKRLTELWNYARYTAPS